MHLGIAPELWLSYCPFRTLRPAEFPTVHQWLVRFARWRRYHVLPEAGGLDDQPEPTLRAFDLCEYALNLPPLVVRQ